MQYVDFASDSSQKRILFQPQTPKTPLRLVCRLGFQVQVDAWSYSQAIDASNALATWETSLELPGHRPSYGWFTRPGKRANITMERSTIFNR